MKVFVVRADFGKYTDTFKKNGCVAIGWFENKEIPISELKDRTNIINHYKAYFPDDVKGRITQNSGQIYRFINEVQIDDIVITPYNDSRLLVGKITSDAYYKKK